MMAAQTKRDKSNSTRMGVGVDSVPLTGKRTWLDRLNRKEQAKRVVTRALRLSELHVFVWMFCGLKVQVM